MALNKDEEQTDRLNFFLKKQIHESTATFPDIYIIQGEKLVELSKQFRIKK